MLTLPGWNGELGTAKCAGLRIGDAPKGALMAGVSFGEETS